jgi:hypothetical protein
LAQTAWGAALWYKEESKRVKFIERKEEATRDIPNLFSHHFPSQSQSMQLLALAALVLASATFIAAQGVWNLRAAWTNRELERAGCVRERDRERERGRWVHKERWMQRSHSQERECVCEREREPQHNNNNNALLSPLFLISVYLSS